MFSPAFKNEDGSIVIVAMNESEKPLKYSVTINSKTTKLEAKPH